MCFPAQQALLEKGVYYETGKLTSTPGNKCLHLRVEPFSEGKQKNFVSVTPMKVLSISLNLLEKKVREKSRECHNHKPQPFLDTKKKRKQTKPNKRKSNKRTKSTKISSLFLKRGNRNAKRTEKHKNKITQGKT